MAALGSPHTGPDGDRLVPVPQTNDGDAMQGIAE